MDAGMGCPTGKDEPQSAKLTRCDGQAIVSVYSTGLARFLNLLFLVPGLLFIVVKFISMVRHGDYH